MSRHTSTCEEFDKNPDYHYECLRGPNGQTIAWTCLYEYGRKVLLKQIKEKIRKVVRRELLDDEANEILSNQIEKLAQQIVRGRFEYPRPHIIPFKYILRKMCDSAAKDEFRKRSNKPLATDLLDKLLIFFKAKERTDDFADYEHLEEAIKKLPPDERRVIELDMEGYSSQEVAKMMGISVAEVYRLRWEARQKLKRWGC